MAHDWGHILAQTVGGIAAQAFAPPPQVTYLGGNLGGATAAPVAGASVMDVLVGSDTANGCEGMEWTGGVPPKGYKVVNFCGKGVLRKIRRRRRRRLFTASDAADVAQIVGIVGKGAMANSLINAGRR